VDEVCSLRSYEQNKIFFLFRHLARISQKGEGQSLKELSNLMYQWELEMQQSRPPGAVFRKPTRAGKMSIQRYLKRLGISHYRCPKSHNTGHYLLLSFQAHWKAVSDSGAHEEKA
jgi:hypothetical protein